MSGWTRHGRRQQYWESAVWPIPLAYLLAGSVLGVAIPALDRALSDKVPATFGVGSSQALLTAFATGLITVMGFIISVVIAGLTFSGTTVTPRMVQEFRRSMTIRHVFGLLLLSVVYAFLVLNRVAPPDNPSYVPDLAVWLVTPLLAMDVIGLLLLVREMGHSLRLVEIIDKIHDRAVEVISSMYTEAFELEGTSASDDADGTRSESTKIATTCSGVVTSLDVRRLCADAAAMDGCIEILRPIGSYVPIGSPILGVKGGSQKIDAEGLVRSVVISDERTIAQDPLYALRLLVDIAARALSPAVNDPTTAVQTLDRIEAILRLLATRRLDHGEIRDENGTVRLTVPLPGWEVFLSVAFTEIRHYGATSVQVVRRTRAVLEDLLEDVPPIRRPGLHTQLDLLDAVVAGTFETPCERELALASDRQGLGDPSGYVRPQIEP